MDTRLGKHGVRGNRYTAVVKAVDADGKVLAKARITLGRY